MGLHPIIMLLQGPTRSVVDTCKALWLSVIYNGADVLSPVAAEEVLRRAALKDRRTLRVSPSVFYR